jgi:hypothetical protein
MIKKITGYNYFFGRKDAPETGIKSSAAQPRDDDADTSLSAIKDLSRQEAAQQLLGGTSQQRRNTDANENDIPPESTPTRKRIRLDGSEDVSVDKADNNLRGKQQELSARRQDENAVTMNDITLTANNNGL